MIEHPTPVARFFAAFQHNNDRGDTAFVVSQFAETFLMAGPQGTQCVRSTDFAMALPRRKELFARLGAKPATLVSLHETPIDARYVLAKTTWRFDFPHANAADEVFVDSTFLLDTGTAECKILLYLSHQDIMELLRERGILTT